MAISKTHNISLPFEGRRRIAFSGDKQSNKKGDGRDRRDAGDPEQDEPQNASCNRRSLNPRHQ